MVVLDLGLVNVFSIIFPFLLVFAILYALFSKFKIVGDNKVIQAVAAIAISFIVILSSDVVELINFISPWFVVLFIFVIMILVVFKLFGTTDETLGVFIKEHTLTQWMIIILAIVIIVAGFAHVFGQRLADTPDTNGDGIIDSSDQVNSDEFDESVGNTIFHPKIVGLIFIFLVAAFAIGLLTQQIKP